MGVLIMGTGNERDTITCETVGEKFQSERDRRNKGKPKSIKAFFSVSERNCVSARLYLFAFGYLPQYTAERELDTQRSF